MKNKYLSVITNFGCHWKCEYCIVRNTGIDIPKTTIQGLDKLVESIRKYDCNWVSISGGGDPCYEFGKNLPWWNKFFEIIPKDIKLELHTSYLNVWKDEAFAGSFDRIVYHCRNFDDLSRVKRSGDQIVRVVFVVHQKFTNKLIDDIVSAVKNNPDIDELSFRQMVDKDYIPTYYCYKKLKAGHGKDWYYIEQNDYNLYYAENQVSFKYEDFRVKETEEEPVDPIYEELHRNLEEYRDKAFGGD